MPKQVLTVRYKYEPDRLVCSVPPRVGPREYPKIRSRLLETIRTSSPRCSDVFIRPGVEGYGAIVTFTYAEMLTDKLHDVAWRQLRNALIEHFRLPDDTKFKDDTPQPYPWRNDGQTP